MGESGNPKFDFHNLENLEERTCDEMEIRPELRGKFFSLHREEEEVLYLL